MTPEQAKSICDQVVSDYSDELQQETAEAIEAMPVTPALLRWFARHSGSHETADAAGAGNKDAISIVQRRTFQAFEQGVLDEKQLKFLLKGN